MQATRARQRAQLRQGRCATVPALLRPCAKPHGRSGAGHYASSRSCCYVTTSHEALVLAQGSMQSKANGALMRVTPLAVWGHKLSDEQLADCVRREAALTHPNVTCQVRSMCAVWLRPPACCGV